jgi:hypothetical protein
MPAAERGAESLYLAIGGTALCLLLLLLALVVFVVRRKVRWHHVALTVSPLKKPMS